MTATNKPKDKYGKTHPTNKEAEYANRCYEMMEWLTSTLDLGIYDAERIMAALIDPKVEGHVARTKFSTFITLTNIYLNKPGSDMGRSP